MTKLTRTFIKPAFSLTLFGREIALVSLDPRKKWTYTEAKGYLLQTRTRHSGVWASQHSYKMALKNGGTRTVGGVKLDSKGRGVKVLASSTHYADKNKSYYVYGFVPFLKRVFGSFGLHKRGYNPFHSLKRTDFDKA